MAALGYFAYSGTFEVCDGAVLHHMEFGIWQRLNGRVETRSIVVLDDDRLVLGTSTGLQAEWQRVH
jgi:hypothetical protein